MEQKGQNVDAEEHLLDKQTADDELCVCAWLFHCDLGKQETCRYAFLLGLVISRKNFIPGNGNTGKFLSHSREFPGTGMKNFFSEQKPIFMHSNVLFYLFMISSKL